MLDCQNEVSEDVESLRRRLELASIGSRFSTSHDLRESLERKIAEIEAKAA